MGENSKFEVEITDVRVLRQNLSEVRWPITQHN
jgi:hypothetical protein